MFLSRSRVITCFFVCVCFFFMYTCIFGGGGGRSIISSILLSNRCVLHFFLFSYVFAWKFLFL